MFKAASTASMFRCFCFHKRNRNVLENILELTSESENEILEEDFVKEGIKIWAEFNASWMSSATGYKSDFVLVNCDVDENKILQFINIAICLFSLFQA